MWVERVMDGVLSTEGSVIGTAYGTSEQLFLFHMSNAQAQAEALERSVTLQIEKGGTTAAASADMDRKIASV